MNPTQYREDWLSAYLDGELSEEQREIVESRLATDTNARATLEDLNRIRLMVAKLPAWNGPNLQFSLPADLLKPKVAFSADDDSSDDSDSNDRITDDSDSTISATEDSPTAAEFDDVATLDDGDANESLPNDAQPWSAATSPRRFHFGWLAAAACITLMVGIGGLLWQPWASDFSVAARNPGAPDGKLDSPSNRFQENVVPANDGPDVALPAPAGNSPAATEFAMPNARYEATLPNVDEQNVLQVDDSQKQTAPSNPPDSALAAITAQPSLELPPAPREKRSVELQSTLPRFGNTTESSLAESAAGEKEMAFARGMGGAKSLNEAQQFDPSAAVPVSPPNADAPVSNERFGLEMDKAEPRLADQVAVDGAQNRGASLPQEAAAPKASTLNIVDQLARSKDAQRVARLRVARSQAWSEQEMDQTLPITASKLGVSTESFRRVLDEGSKVVIADDFAGSDKAQLGKDISKGQTTGANEAAKVMMAAIDGEVSAEDVFQELIKQQDARQAGAADAQAKNRPQAKRDLSGQSFEELPPPSTGQDEKTKRLNETQVQSIVLYVSSVEAETILAQLKARGAVRHNAWVIVPSAPDTKLSDQKVILILNGPP